MWWINGFNAGRVQLFSEVGGTFFQVLKHRSERFSFVRVFGYSNEYGLGLNYIMVHYRINNYKYSDSQPFLWFDVGYITTSDISWSNRMLFWSWSGQRRYGRARHIVCRLCRVPGRWPSRTNQPSPSTLTLDPCPLGHSCIYSHDALRRSHQYLQTSEYSKTGGSKYKYIQRITYS